MAPTTTGGTTAQTQTTTAAATTDASKKTGLGHRLREAQKAYKAAGPTPTTSTKSKSKKWSLFETVQSVRGLHRAGEPTATTQKTRTTVTPTSQAPAPPPKPTGTPTPTTQVTVNGTTTVPTQQQKKTQSADNTTFTSLVRSYIPSRQTAMYILGGVAVGATMLGGLGWYLDQSGPTGSTALSGSLGTVRLSDLSRDIGSMSTGNSSILLPAQGLRLDTYTNTLAGTQPLISISNTSPPTTRTVDAIPRRRGGPRRAGPRRGRKARGPNLLDTLGSAMGTGVSLVGKGAGSVLGGIGNGVRMFGAGRELAVPGLKK